MRGYRPRIDTAAATAALSTRAPIRHEPRVHSLSSSAQAAYPRPANSPGRRERSPVQPVSAPRHGCAEQPVQTAFNSVCLTRPTCSGNLTNTHRHRRPDQARVVITSCGDTGRELTQRRPPSTINASARSGMNRECTRYPRPPKPTTSPADTRELAGSARNARLCNRSAHRNTFAKQPVEKTPSTAFA